MRERLEAREIRRRGITRDAAAAPLDMVDLDAEPTVAEPPKRPEPTLRWGSWGSLRRRRAVAAGR